VGMGLHRTLGRCPTPLIPMLIKQTAATVPYDPELIFSRHEV
jgi:hypothetical protein